MAGPFLVTRQQASLSLSLEKCGFPGGGDTCSPTELMKQVPPRPGGQHGLSKGCAGNKSLMHLGTRSTFSVVRTALTRWQKTRLKRNRCPRFPYSPSVGQRPATLSSPDVHRCAELLARLRGSCTRVFKADPWYDVLHGLKCPTLRMLGSSECSTTGFREIKQGNHITLTILDTEWVSTGPLQGQVGR